MTERALENNASNLPIVGRLASQEMVWPSLLVLVTAIAVVAMLAPADKTLGDLVKLVYVHGALIQVSLAIFPLAGLLGASFLLVDRPALYDWSQALLRAGLVLWVLYVITSALSMTLAWGGIAWFEPRWVVAVQVLVVAPVLHLAGMLMQNRRLQAFLNAATAGIIWFLVSQARLVMHPLNPVFGSSNSSIILAYDLLLVLWAATALQLARAMWGLGRLREAPARA